MSEEKKVVIKQEKSLDSDSEESDGISINIKTLDGRTYPLRVPKNITIADLKQSIQAEIDVPVAAQRLIFKGKALKEDQKLSSYTIEEGHTIHMVARPPGEQPSSSQQNQTSQSNLQHPQPTTPTTTTGANIFGGRMPNVMMSTIAIPTDEVTDLNQFVASVVNSLGMNLANASATGVGPIPVAGFGTIAPNRAGASGPATTISATSPLENIQQGLNNTAGITTAALPTITNTEVSSREEGAAPNSAESLGQYISQYRSEMERSFPLLDRLSLLLRNESALQDPQQRNEAQQLAQSVSRLFRTLGLSMAFSSNVLNSIQMGTTPGQALNLQAPRAQGNAPGNIDEQPVAGIPVFIHPPGSVPPGFRQQNPANQTRANPSQPASGQPANPFGDLLGSMSQNPNENPIAAIGQMFGPMFQQIQQSVSSTINNTVAQGSTPSLSNIVNSVFSTMFRPPGATDQPTEPAVATPIASTPTMATATSPIATRSIPSTTANTTSQPMDIDPSERATTSTNIGAASRPSTIPIPVFPQDDSGATLAQMFQAVTQALAQGEQLPASSIIRSVVGSLDGNDEEADLPLSEMLRLVMDSLTLQEILAVMGGDWTPLEKVQKAIREYIFESLQGDVSPPRLEHFSRSILQSIRTSLDEKNLPEELKQRLIPGRDVSVTDTFLSVLTTHVHKLVLLVMTPSEATSANPFPFANSLRDWTLYFVGEFFTTLSPYFIGGVGDVYKLVVFFLNQRFSLTDPTMSNMATNIIAQFIMTTYNRYLSLSVQYPTEDNWQSIIEEDERIQATMTPQEQPFSDAYLSGVELKKRKELTQQ